ncbi:MAG: phage tail tape measure protein, partial [Muribaculaceae bacterium]
VKSLTDINQASASYCAEERSRLDMLYNAATNENLAREARIKAVKDLQKLYPEYFGNLSVEAIMTGQAKTQYDDLTKSILAAAKARAAAELIQKNSGNLINLEIAGDDLKTQLATAKKKYADLQAESWAVLAQGGNYIQYLEPLGALQKEINRLQLLYDANIQAQDKIKQANETLANRYSLTGTNTPTVTPIVPGTPEPTTTSPTGTTDRFAEEKAKRKELEDLARIDYQTGIDNYQQYTERMAAIAVDYYSGLLERQDLTDQERLAAEADYAESSRKLRTAQYATDVANEEADYADLLDRLRRNHAERINQEGITADELRREDDYYAEVTELAELNHLRNMRDIYEEGSAEWLAADRKYQDKQIEAQERHRRKMADIVAKAESEYASIKDKYFGDSQQEREQKYQHALDVLNQVYQRELIAAGDNAAEKLRIEEAYLKALAALREQYGVVGGVEGSSEDGAGGLKGAIEKSAKWLESDGGKALTRGLSTAVSSMSSIFSGLTSLIQAETELQTAAVERRYDKEIESAQGSSYKVAMLEKKKEQEIAAIKNAASRKQYSMQVVQAIAQTAQNALAAYGSALAIPAIGWILAPIAAAAAVAAGMIQVAAIKKQQQAAEAQGYASGGFTRPGAVNEPAGIVHAGEWVASQRLLANPVARPMIDALDYAQRTNTIGSLRADDVSRSITATNTLARVTETDEGAI